MGDGYIVSCTIGYNRSINMLGDLTNKNFVGIYGIPGTIMLIPTSW